MTKALIVEYRNPLVAPHIRTLGAEEYRDTLLAEYGSVDEVAKARQMAREFKDNAGPDSYSARNTKAAMSAARAMGLTPCQIHDMGGFLVNIQDLSA